jgi:hypothetical protein
MKGKACFRLLAYQSTMHSPDSSSVPGRGKGIEDLAGVEDIVGLGRVCVATVSGQSTVP